jgi:hypothetical protein
LASPEKYFPKLILEQRKEKTGSLDVYDQFDAYIESKKRRIAPATVNIYMEVKRYLQALKNSGVEK